MRPYIDKVLERTLMNLRTSRGEESSGEGGVMTGLTQELNIVNEEGIGKEGDINEGSYYNDMFNLASEVSLSLPQV